MWSAATRRASGVLRIDVMHIHHALSGIVPRQAFLTAKNRGTVENWRAFVSGLGRFLNVRC